MEVKQPVLRTESAEFKLVPARLNLTTHKTQVATGAALAALCAAALGISLALPVGAAFCLATILVALLASEAGGRGGSRLGGVPAFWSALLFALWAAPAYRQSPPGNAGSLALLVVLFLLSITTYLRWRSTNSPIWLRVSTLCATAAYFTRPEAAAIPLVITAAELLLPDTETLSTAGRRNMRLIAPLYFWLSLSFAFTVGQLEPAMVPVLGVRELLVAPASNWQAIAETAVRTLLPTGQPASNIFMAGLALIPVSCLILFAARAGQIRLLLFFFIFVAVALINPLLAAAPLALLCTFAALPAAGPVPLRLAAPAAIIGAVGLTLIAIAWFYTNFTFIGG